MFYQSTNSQLMKYKGSCLCGSIRFEIEGEFENFILCHCHLCRKDTGSAHASNLFSTSAKLHWLSGKELVKNYEFNSTGYTQSFCLNCGSALPRIQMGGTLLCVPAGSLDSDVNITPKAHIYMDDKGNWDHDLESIPKYAELPTNKNNK